MSTLQLPPSPPENRTEPTESRTTWRHERSRGGNEVLAALLIAFGLLFLVSNVYAVGGGAFLIAIGLAFAFARVTTRRYGFAVPAGILLGLGAFTTLLETGALTGNSGGWSLVFLALGFVSAYVIGWRPAAIWPFFPALILGLIGVALLGAPSLAPLASYVWIASYWPVVLILLGLWILARAYLPPEIRRPIGLLALTVAIVYGVFAFAAAIAASVAYFPTGASAIGATGAPWLNGAGQSVTLNAPLGATNLLRIVNPTGGTTTIRASNRTDVQAVVTARSWFVPASVGNVALTQSGGALLLDPGSPAWLNGAQLDYVVDVPATTSIDARATSGRLDLRGTTGAVTIDNSTGSVYLAQLTGPVTVHTSSGSIDLADVSGALQVSSTSGSLHGTNLAALRSAATTSGSINLAGTFRGDTQVQSVSGSIDLQLGPESSTQITATTISGSISSGGLSLSNPSQERRFLSGTIGDGAGSLRVSTISGSIALHSGS